MINEDYCSYEVSKLLKEKGFEGDINVYYHIWDNGNKVCSVQEFSHSEAPHLYIPAPTHQMAMKWLRKVHNIAINIGWGEVFEDKFQWWCIILSLKDGSILREPEYYATYEEAVESALKYSLENLI